jgi:hypothetical protein
VLTVFFSLAAASVAQRARKLSDEVDELESRTIAGR